MTTSFALTAPDLVLEAFERLQIKSSEITPDHMFSVKRSMNLVQSKWSNRGANLWKVDPAQEPTVIELVPGIGSYTLDSSVIMVYEVWLRTFPMGASINLTPGLTTTGSGGDILTESGQPITTESGQPLVTESSGTSSTTVKVNWPDHGEFVGDYVNFVVPVSVGGVIVLGFYKIASIVDPNNFFIDVGVTVPVAATGGVTPQFTTTQGSNVVAVLFPSHGLTSGGVFAVQLPTSVGGISLLGEYTVSVIDANNFTIIATPAVFAQTVMENGGFMQIQGQIQSDPIDRIITPLSRSEYAALPDKIQPGTVTQYYFDRQKTPTMNFWQVPFFGPQEVRMYCVHQMQDADVLLSGTPDIPYRFNEALCADLAYHLSKKYPPKRESGITRQDLKMDAEEAWMEAMSEDRERVSMYLVPDLSGYFQ